MDIVDRVQLIESVMTILLDGTKNGTTYEDLYDSLY